MTRVLVADLGNTTLFLGVFSSGKWTKRFRVSADSALTPKGFGKLVSSRLRGRFDAAALCSVQPDQTSWLRQRMAELTGIEPRVLTHSAAGMPIGYYRPGELGVDRIACALGAQALHPGRDCLVVDCGTATTVTAISRDGKIQGGAILPGLGLWPQMLAARTARLPAIDLRRPRKALGRSTREALQSGMVIGHAGAIRELTQRVGREAFGPKSRPIIVGTGGNTHLLAKENLFTVIAPELILTGLLRFAAPSAIHA